ncbi:hypothetical protein ACQY1Q_06065 [Tenacibaculum sp. TC6]|uniref:hypothetical protein n=1 Tax=Tenacibaculum sp. TC6 TaxID=3423223 RepID=UPI003D365C03
MKINNKDEALTQLNTLEEKVLCRLAELSTNPKALEYFSNPIKFATVKAFLN